MSKITFKTNPRVVSIFNDLDKYQAFCKEYGYKFDEADLYNNRSAAYRQYGKLLAGKPVRNMWSEDKTRFEQR
jgi:hypothetical protein